MRYLPLLLLTACLPTERRVDAAIDEANFCEVAEDCVDVGSVCPFGCNILVNESEVDDITALLDRFERGRPGMCVYDCAMMLSVSCEENRCVGNY